MTVDGFNATVTDADVRKALAPLKDLDKRVRRRVLSKMARAGGAEQLKILRQLLPKKRGLLRRSTKTKVKGYGGTHVAISGQAKGKEYKKTKYKPHGGLSGQGTPPPLHLVVTKVQSHLIPGRINWAGMQTRGTRIKGPRKGIRNDKPMTLPGGFAWRVRHPGMPHRDLMGKVHARSVGSALRAALKKAQEEIEKEALAAAAAAIDG